LATFDFGFDICDFVRNEVATVFDGDAASDFGLSRRRLGTAHGEGESLARANQGDKSASAVTNFRCVCSRSDEDAAELGPFDGGTAGGDIEFASLEIELRLGGGDGIDAGRATIQMQVARLQAQLGCGGKAQPTAIRQIEVTCRLKSF